MAAFKTTVLADIEKEYDAKMAPAGGWSLAKNFPGGVSAEERHTVENCSVFDRCHTARFRVTGTDVFKKISAIAKFETETIAADDLLAGSFGDEQIILLCMAVNDCMLLTEKRSVAEQIAGKLSDLEFTDLSDVLAQLDVAGAKLSDVLADFEIAFEELPVAGKILKRVVAEVNSILFVNTEFSIPAITLIFSAEYAEGMWEEFVDTYPVKPAGFSAREKLAGVCEE